MSLITQKVSLWNRIEEDPSAELNQVLEMFSKHHAAIETEQIKRAYHEAQEAHDGQIRKSGMPILRTLLQLQRLLHLWGLMNQRS
tara:strand:- start:1454 stop:1708 length:255 start_codon:yes stop_codon:yes gene_type:complete